MRRLLIAFPLLAAACASESSAPSLPRPIRPHGAGGELSLPDIDMGGATFRLGATFTFTGATAPGTAAWTDAPHYDWDAGGTCVDTDGDGRPETCPPDPVPGSGAYAITIDGVTYGTGAAPQTITWKGTSDDGTPYVVVDGFAELADGTVNEYLVILRDTDVVPGTTVALDGVDRVALFASGTWDDYEPTLVAAAVSGTVTITSGDATSAAVTATVAGDFGKIDWSSSGGGGGGGTITETLPTGAYTLSYFGRGEVYCDGTMAGQEAAFGALDQASLGFVDGAVTIDLAADGAYSIAGAPITSGFHTSPLALAPGDDTTGPDGMFMGVDDLGATGPAGPGAVANTRAANFLLLEGTDAAAPVAAYAVTVFATPSGDGTCQINFGGSID